MPKWDYLVDTLPLNQAAFQTRLSDLGLHKWELVSFHPSTTPDRTGSSLEGWVCVFKKPHPSK